MITCLHKPNFLFSSANASFLVFLPVVFNSLLTFLFCFLISPFSPIVKISKPLSGSISKGSVTVVPVDPVVTTSLVSPVVTVLFVPPVVTTSLVDPVVTTSLVDPVVTTSLVDPVVTTSLLVSSPFKALGYLLFNLSTDGLYFSLSDRLVHVFPPFFCVYHLPSTTL